MNDAIPGDGQQSPSREQAEYNRLFDVLVNDAPKDELIVGFVSYAYYKIAKREYVSNFYEQNGRHPNEAEMRAYIDGWTDSRIDGLKTEANQSLSNFSSLAQSDLSVGRRGSRTIWRRRRPAACPAAMLVDAAPAAA